MPEFIEVSTISRFISKLAFRRLFTMEERVLLDNYEVNVNLTTEQKMTIKTLHRDMELATYIDLNDPDTISGVNYLETVGLISVGRANEILSATV